MAALALAVLLLAVCGVYGSMRNVTADMLGPDSAGLLAAFGDFNADKLTDLFIARNGNELRVFFADLKGSPYFLPKVKLLLGEEDIITSVVPGDYNGDSQMDVLLTTVPKGQADTPMSATIYWGQNQTLSVNQKTPLNRSYSDEPLIMDFNGDLIPDIFGVPSGSQTPLIIYGGDLSANTTLEVKNEMLVPHSHAFIDLNGDFTADGDGFQDLLLPTCEDDQCLKSIIYVWKGDSQQWVSVLQDFRNQNTVWGFVPPSSPASVPITLRIGDYNMDGYPDALAVLRDTSGSDQQAFLLENIPCKNTTCSRVFSIHWEISDLNQIKDAEAAAFFDIYEDGILDVIVLGKGSAAKNNAIHFLMNNFEADAYFVKVIVLSGFCSSDCPHQVKPFGVNQPGPYIMYTTVDANGYLKNASAGQLSQSAHLSLQLPYNVLGLGRSANFLDHLYVGIPRPPGEQQIRRQEWTAIIPNSQLIVIPYPHQTPRSWSAKLYLTPSNIVLLTAIALIGVCVFILAIIGILHWQEKKADDREKRQEAHRFHFDAM
uniref:Integrin alpha FG-GAP repeat containing 1 n=1 Tax=Leptobrachium leishanense TaxID=445787 RepID=A0A8C5PZK1_9ANUR